MSRRYTHEPHRRGRDPCPAFTTCTIGRTRSHNVNHLLPDRTDLAALRVARLADLVRPPLGEGERKEAQGVAVNRLDVCAGLDQRLPLADEAVELVARHVHAIKVGQQCLALNLLPDELDLTVVKVLGAVQVGKRHLKDAALECLRRDLCKINVGISVGMCLTNHAHQHDDWRTQQPLEMRGDLDDDSVVTHSCQLYESLASSQQPGLQRGKAP